jgi:hypothetical protein
MAANPPVSRRGNHITATHVHVEPRPDAHPGSVHLRVVADGDEEWYFRCGRAVGAEGWQETTSPVNCRDCVDSERTCLHAHDTTRGDH